VTKRLFQGLGSGECDKSTFFTEEQPYAIALCPMLGKPFPKSLPIGESQYCIHEHSKSCEAVRSADRRLGERPMAVDNLPFAIFVQPVDFGAILFPERFPRV